AGVAPVAPAPAVAAPTEVSPASLPSRPDAMNPHLEFIVKFDPVEAERLRDLFIESPERARSAFRRLARDHAAFRNLRLERISYRGECTLVYEGDLPSGAGALDTLSKEILNRLNGAPSVEYAEPNLVAWRGAAQP
ncbi:MAG: hypothetical protein MI723_13075, partial [Caulobacterales bacterium]|nr:hypothetical protein [Caulobacterales bacterium]